MPELIFFRRGDEVLRFAVDRPKVLIGRGERNDVVIPDPQVSRQQAAIHIDQSRALLEDLSGRGTCVAGAMTHEAELSDGVDIALGQWRAVFRKRASESNGDEATELKGTQTLPQTVQAATAPRVPAQLRVRQGPNEWIHPFEGEGLSLGKDAGNDVVLTDPLVSARHLRISRRGSLFQVRDPGSTNGTYLGATRLFDAEVPLHTLLRLGGSELVLEPLGSERKGQEFEGIIGSDPSVRQLCELIERVAPSTASVAIFGESGTGKELVALAVHARSSRAERPFIPVNCAAISKELIESELFGHEKGAFTGAAVARKGAFEEASGGTLFLDEIGELPLDLQAKLLRALESGEIKRVGASKPLHVDVRVVTATNRDLLAAARRSEFREDLYYRLCVVPLHLPPLRNRKGDILALAEHFLTRFSPRGQQVRLTAAAIERLRDHRWPGNIRELRNVVHRALLLRKGPMIDAPDITFDETPDEEAAEETELPPSELTPGLTLQEMLDRTERRIVETALRKYGDNRERVAKELGVARSTLFKRLKEWGLTNG